MSAAVMSRYEMVVRVRLSFLEEEVAVTESELWTVEDGGECMMNDVFQRCLISNELSIDVDV
jgi:hypothetical protein